MKKLSARMIINIINSFVIGASCIMGLTTMIGSIIAYYITRFSRRKFASMMYNITAHLEELSETLPAAIVHKYLLVA